jgi:FO synthase
MDPMTFDDALHAPLAEVRAEARALNERRHHGRVSYVVNRNANFTNICNVGCTFCGFQRAASAPDAYRRTPRSIVDRLLATPGITEVCLQGGIDPVWQLHDYTALLHAIKTALPAIHIHAFSPMELEHMSRQSGRSIEDVLLELREAGLGTIPGTAAEILVDSVRAQVSGNKLDSEAWIRTIRTAHRLGIRSTATVMYGHVETWDDIRTHFEILASIQQETGGFTELVPLAFIPYKNRLGRRLVPDGDFAAFEARSRARAERLYPLARIVFDPLIPHLQTSWVKLGPETAALSLDWGCNDFGGTLYEESITRESGGPHGECLEPATIAALIRSAGKTPVERDTLYRPVMRPHPAAVP